MAHSISETPPTVIDEVASSSGAAAGGSTATFKHAPLVERLDWSLTRRLPAETRMQIMQWVFAREPASDSIARLGEFRQVDAESGYGLEIRQFVLAGNSAAWAGSAHLRGLWLTDRLHDASTDDSDFGDVRARVHARACIASVAACSESIVVSLNLLPDAKIRTLLDGMTSGWNNLRALAFNVGGSFTATSTLLEKLPGMMPTLGRLNHLKLDFSGVSLTPDQMAQIGALPVTTLVLAGCGLTNDHLEALLPCPSLKVLDISRNDLYGTQWNAGIPSPTEAFTRLGRHQGIVSLSLAECSVGYGGVLGLRHMGGLRALDVRSSQLLDLGIVVLSSLPLTSLRLDGNRCTERGARALGSSVTLRDLSVRGMDLKGSIGLVATAPALQRLDAGRNKIGLAGLDALLASQSLQSVVLDGNILGNQSALVLSANTWRHLDVSNNDIELTGAEALVTNASDALEALNLRGNLLPASSHAALNAHAAVRRYSLPG